MVNQEGRSHNHCAHTYPVTSADGKAASADHSAFHGLLQPIATT